MNISKNMIAASLAAVVALVGASGAQADTLQGKYTSSFSKNVNITKQGWVHGPTGGVPTVTFNWVRQDLAGPGVDSLLPSTFISYCVDLDQGVSGGVTNTFNVVSMADAGYTPNQRLMLGRLWSSFQPQVNTSDKSAAFQLAVWELVYDTGLDMSTGIFKVNSPDGSKSLAQSWLNTISSVSYEGGRDSLVVLRSGTVQDQIAMVPAPGSLALLSIGALTMTRRRR